MTIIMIIIKSYVSFLNLVGFVCYRTGQYMIDVCVHVCKCYVSDVYLHIPDFDVWVFDLDFQIYYFGFA